MGSAPPSICRSPRVKIDLEARAALLLASAAAGLCAAVTLHEEYEKGLRQLQTLGKAADGLAFLDESVCSES